MLLPFLIFFMAAVFLIAKLTGSTVPIEKRLAPIG